MLSTLYYYKNIACEDPLKPSYSATKYTRGGEPKEIQLCASDAGITEIASTGRVIDCVYYCDVDEINTIKDKTGGVMITMRGRKRVYILDALGKFIKEIRKKCETVGELIEEGNEVTFSRALKLRDLYNTDPVLSTFSLHKITPRHTAPVPRTIQLTEKAIIERDLETYIFLLIVLIFIIFSK